MTFTFKPTCRQCIRWTVCGGQNVSRFPGAVVVEAMDIYCENGAMKRVAGTTVGLKN